MTQSLPMPTFTQQQLDLAHAGRSRLTLRAHHGVPVPEGVVAVSLREACNAVSNYAAAHGLHVPRWPEFDAQRYAMTFQLVEDLLALRAHMALDDPLAVVFWTTVLYTAAPFLVEPRRRPVHIGRTKPRGPSISTRAHLILHADHREHGARIGDIAMKLYHLDAPAGFDSAEYARTQGALHYLQGLRRAKVTDDLWTWEHTNDGLAEIEKLRADDLHEP